MAIPTTQRTDQAGLGGTLVGHEVADTILDGVVKQAGLLSLANVQRVSKPKINHPIITVDATAYEVGQLAVIPTTNVETDDAEVVARKFATIVPLANEIPEEVENEQEFFQAVSIGVDEAFNQVWERAIMGYGINAETGEQETVSSQVDFQLSDLVALGQVIDVDLTKPDWQRRVSSEIMKRTRKARRGLRATGLLLPIDAEADVRDAEDPTNASKRVYDSANPYYNLQVATTTELPDIPTADEVEALESDLIIGFGGDFRQLFVPVLKTITLEKFTSGNVGELNLLEQDAHAYKWRSRLGAGCARPQGLFALRVKAPEVG